MGDADVVHGRAPLRWPRQLLPQVCLTLLRPCRPSHGPLQPPGSVHVGSSRAAELRRTQSSADLGAGATRVGPGAADAPAHRRLELAMLAILEQPDDAGAFHPVAFDSRKLTQPERSYPPRLLELLAVVHALKAQRPYLLDKPFELHTDNLNAILQWLQQQRHVSHHQVRWLNLLAEYQYRVVHIPGRTNPADSLTQKRFPDGQGPAPHTGYDKPLRPRATTSGACGWSRPSRPPAPGRRRATLSGRYSTTWGCLTCSSRTATRASPAHFGRACTRRWVHRSSSARHTITALTLYWIHFTGDHTFLHIGNLFHVQYASLHHTKKIVPVAS